jgi:uncharacterized protein (DUF2141 family)
MLVRSAFLLAAAGLFASTRADHARRANHDRTRQPGAPGTVTVTVIVSGISATGGRLGAALFTAPAGFPDAPVPLSLIHPHTSAPADTFVFRNLAPGRYAVAVQHDLNGNGVVDRNLVGAPKEPWGVSRDIRYTFRAPKFEEALVEVRADTTIAVRVAK